MGFFKLLGKVLSKKIGEVTGNDFCPGNKVCYLGSSKKDGAPALMFFGIDKEDFIFNKSDIKGFTPIETNTTIVLRGGGQTGGSPYVQGNKYKVVFKNDKTAILNVPMVYCTAVENVLY